MKIKTEWECIMKPSRTEDVSRAKVFGGWVVRTICTHTGNVNTAISESSIFVPDPNHEWEIE
jgi:hypothetical protein